MRKHLREIARDRMTAAGVGNVNRKMARVQDGMKNWRRALTGESGKAAFKAQMLQGMQIKKHKEFVKASRKAAKA